MRLPKGGSAWGGGGTFPWHRGKAGPPPPPREQNDKLGKNVSK